MPTVSIVIPSYNNADHIAETMDSVLNQTYDDYEVIVSDHSSTDGTWEILARYADDPRVTLVREPTGGGAPRNWNAVSALATGEYIKLVCGDDLIRPTMLERQVDAFSDGVVLVASSRDLVDANGDGVVKNRGLGGITRRVPGPEAIRATVRAGSNIFGEPACVLMRRSDFEAAGRWDPSQSYLIDEASYARVLLRGDFVPVRESLAAFRISVGQWSVRLAGSQAQEAVDFHNAFARVNPGVLSPGDVRIGNVRAHITALMRRAAYLVLGSRMSRKK